MLNLRGAAHLVGAAGIDRVWLASTEASESASPGRIICRNVDRIGRYDEHHPCGGAGTGGESESLRLLAM
ncbi:hypothetical protein BN6_79920 [Saccharothrix espanaensis DSM 44229]|uniref:Uncharacterized protein n=1 Tax=Saccharothrix espanaensis (strain ATCC 51144 / DSM 44229 / JCM 9112 / NBRC 15066 / NRRL 15764) TaxID=1179773 RepID=K0K4M3_SACES|nr:hypothetical protein BN6_79920 [Saccharothrix espanaensis DSM 44229]